MESFFDEITPDIVRYVGDGSWWRPTKKKHSRNPDFKITSQNKVIELFGDYWHEGENPVNIIDEYKNIGIHCLVFWEKEIYNNTENILKKVNKFINRPCINFYSKKIKEITLYQNRDWLYGKYIIKKLSAVQIAKLCNVPVRIIYEYLHKYNIPTRTISENNKIGYNSNPIKIKIDESILKQLYAKYESVPKIANKFGASSHTIYNNLKRYNIQVISNRGKYKKRVKIKCANCGKEFMGYKYRKFCKHPCYVEFYIKNKIENKGRFIKGHVTWNKGTKEIIIKVCKYCGKDFKIWLSEKKRRKYCSCRCSNLAKRKRIKVICKQCGKEFEVNAKRKRKYCSRECMGLSRRKNKNILTNIFIKKQVIQLSLF